MVWPLWGHWLTKGLPETTLATETETTSDAEKSASIAAKLAIGPLNAPNQKLTKAKAKVRKAEAKEAKVAKDSGCRDLATHAVDLTWPGSVSQRARAVKDFLCRQLGVHGGRLRSQDRRRSSGDNGCFEKARTRARAKARESLA